MNKNLLLMLGVGAAAFLLMNKDRTITIPGIGTGIFDDAPTNPNYGKQHQYLVNGVWMDANGLNRSGSFIKNGSYVGQITGERWI
jgi:hypothetical protein